MGAKTINSCVTCGHKLSVFDSFCPLCGTKRHVKCSVCANVVDCDAVVCPSCGSALKSSFLRTITLYRYIIAFLVFVFFFSVVPFIPNSISKNTKSYNKNKIVEHKKDIYSDENLYYEIIGRMGGESIRISDMINFSDLNSEDILTLRSQAVKTSPVFKDLHDYVPSREVFEMEDGLPWIGAMQAACVGTEGPNYQIGEGDSRESLMILNPELILHPLIPTILNNSPNECDESYYFVPRKVVYYEDTKTITTYIDLSSVKAKLGYIPQPYFLETANPRDLGYSAIFASDYYNLDFDNQTDNMALNISEPRGFWHRGYACGLPEGCNNYSPRDTRYEIRIKKLPAAIRVKLWKNTPRFKNKRADLTYEIVFE